MPSSDLIFIDLKILSGQRFVRARTHAVSLAIRVNDPPALDFGDDQRKEAAGGRQGGPRQSIHRARFCARHFIQPQHLVRQASAQALVLLA